MKITFILLVLLIISCKEKNEKGASIVEASKTEAAPLTQPAPSINYTVPDENNIRRIAQPSANSCWATVATMMWTWKHKSNSTIVAFLSSLSDPTYKIIFEKDSGISGSQKESFLANASLKFQYPASFVPSFIESRLKLYGPIWVTTKESPDENFSFVHARICYGIFGDGTPNGTFLKLIDPAGALELSESFEVFIKKYESASGISIQMVHW